jgi:hypothetical protein
LSSLDIPGLEKKKKRNGKTISAERKDFPSASRPQSLSPEEITVRWLRSLPPQFSAERLPETTHLFAGTGVSAGRSEKPR